MQEYRSGLQFPPPGDLPDQGMEPAIPLSPALQVDSLSLSHYYILEQFIHLGDIGNLDFCSQYDDFVIGFETQSFNSAYDH